ncbi:MAG: undecaprenyl-diphosphate phosphatase [Patescibacteria group bacterium]|nr:undecaprenyl-diphosphate phosphatase [Patescibacteria group bacterium]
MTLGQSLLLGLVQGLTEFLPISSTAHLVAAQNFLGLTTPPVSFDIVIHLATALATIIVLWSVIKKLNWPMVKLIVVASIPTGILGLYFNRWNELIFGSLLFTAVTLIINGLILLLPKLIKAKNKNLNNQSATVIGVAQGLAVLPGISRSGSTIVAGLLFGLKPKDAYNFSFLISLPAIAAAQLLQIDDLRLAVGELPNYIVGFSAAGVSGYLALLWLKRIVSRGQFTGFAIYCLILGGLLLLL